VPATPVTVANDARIAGWFGKVPALGDFASRRLPESFVARWDPWLQLGLMASREMLGERWLEVYLNAPIRRFELAPGVVDQQAWVGILMASVDRVGRHFPLTMAVALAAGAPPASRAMEADAWFAGIGALALRALDLSFTVEQLEEGLAALPYPALDERSAPPLRGSAWWIGASTVATSMLEFEGLPSPADFARLLSPAV
jgi:type VI secretion system protein ImpM